MNRSWAYLTILLLILGFSESRDASIKEITTESVLISYKTENETETGTK